MEMRRRVWREILSDSFASCVSRLSAASLYICMYVCMYVSIWMYYVCIWVCGNEILTVVGFERVIERERRVVMVVMVVVVVVLVVV